MHGYLKWIEDNKLETIVTNLLSKAHEARSGAVKKFGKNVIDPFSAIFEMAGFDIQYNDWIESEKTRQAQKTLQNHIGNFHQGILGCVEGWTDKKTGSVVDLVSTKKKVLAEIKNKYNTVSGGKLADLYDMLSNQVMPKNSIYKSFNAYYVCIIPRKPERYDRPFTPSDKEQGEKRPVNEKIRETDGASFYSLVTGSPTALEDLFDILPDLISKCSSGKYEIEEREKLKEFFSLAFE